MNSVFTGPGQTAVTLTPLPAASECSGSWYSVGRVNYSMRDSRITDSVLGFEYDAGCWIGRVVAERLNVYDCDVSPGTAPPRFA